MEFITEFTEEFESFVGVNFWTMIFAWVNILILYLFLKKLLFKPVKNMIDARQKEIDDLYTDAEEKSAAAAALKETYEKECADAGKKGEEIVRTAVRNAHLREEEILKEADEMARRTLRRAEEQVELEKKQALADVKNEVSSMAVEIAAAVIGRDVSESEHSELIDGMIDKL